MGSALTHVTFIAVPVSPDVDTVTMRLILVNVALVTIPIGESVDAMSVGLPVSNLTLVAPDPSAILPFRYSGARADTACAAWARPPDDVARSRIRIPKPTPAADINRPSGDGRFSDLLLRGDPSLRLGRGSEG